MRKSLTRICLLIFVCSVFSLAQSLTGTWTHASDSDGTTPLQGKTMTLTFDSGNACHLKATDASGKEKTVTGDGTYSVRGGTLTMTLAVLDLKVSNQAFTLSGDNLTLPFKLFNEGEGTSSWVRAGVTTPSPSPQAETDASAMASGGFPQPRSTGGMKAELHCNCNNKTYDTPKECLDGCNVRSGLSGNMQCGSMLVRPNPCPVLRNDTFKLLYDQIILHHLQVIPTTLTPLSANSSDTPGDGRVILVGKLIDLFYKPWSVNTDFFVAIASGSSNDGEFAHVEPANGGRLYLRVGSAALESSPGGLVSIIGHEMIHAEQFRRTYTKVSLPGFNPFTRAMNELEAWSWQTGVAMNFRWKIGTNQAWKCETLSEQDYDIAVQKCRIWQVRETLIRVNKDRELQGAVERWINENPWAKSVWLPANRDWKNVTSNSLPPIVPFDHDRNNGIDCRQGLQ